MEKDPYIYEIQDPTLSGELTTFESNYQFIPTSARVGRTYRARVRHKDTQGRWSHWSDPVQFEVTSPETGTYVDSLRITELHYHPNEANLAEQEQGWSTSDFEYIELQNISGSDLDLTNLRLTKGVNFDFATGTIIRSKDYLLVVKNRAAFESRFGAGLPIAGEWEEGNRLDNGGENLKLSYGAGISIIEFTYDDADPWPEGPDGNGFSLNLENPENTQPENNGNAGSWYSGSASPGSIATRVEPSLSLIVLEDPLRFEFNSVKGNTYHIEVSEDLSKWTTVEKIVADGSKTLHKPILNIGEKLKFFRVRKE